MKTHLTVNGKISGLFKHLKNINILLMLIFLPLVSLGCASSGAQTTGAASNVNDNSSEIAGTEKVHTEIFRHPDPGQDSVYFDEEKFQESMKKLKEKLSRIRIKFDNDSCWSRLGEINVHKYFDSEKFKRDMKKLSKKIKCDVMAAEKFKSDMSGLERSMEKLKEKMKGLKWDMKGLRSKMKKLKSFMKDMRHELVKDGYIEDKSEDFDLLLNGHEMIVNGKKLPENLFEKYKKMYKEHFGKEITDDNAFRIRN